jgi:peptidoglycan/xylan/chitin deacetylase (PgdA/CDA1 family)
MDTHGGERLAWGQVLVGVAALALLAWGGLAAVFAVPVKPAAEHHREVSRHAARHAATQAVAGAAAPIDCAHVPCLALTFDDGPSAVITPQVLDILERHHVRATFYVVGSRVAGNEPLLQRMHAEGHEIGNHSWGHTNFTTLTPQQIHDEITLTQAAVAAAGVPMPTTFRPPYGAMNPVAASNVPLTVVRWNVDPEDWGTHKPQEIIDRVKAQARPGGVVDLHDIHQQTADSLDVILNDLSPHYNWVTVSELFSLPPGQRGDFSGR